MALYFFHLRDGVELMHDPDGRNLDGHEAVAGAALREARALIAADALSGKIRLDQRIEVENEQGMVVHRLNFWDAVKIVRPH